jgi:integrase/recombinase XerC
MASIAKRVRVNELDWTYELRWREGNTNRRVALRTQNLRTAKTALRQLNQGLLEKRFDFLKTENDLSLTEFRDRYMEYREPRMALKTIQADRLSLNSLRNCIGDVPLKSITTQLLEDAFISIRLKQVKSSSVNVETRHLKSAFNYAVEHEYIESNPFKKIKLLKVERPGKKFFTVDELKRIDDAIIREDDKLLMWFLVLTGMRISEFLSLKWNDIHIEQAIIKVRGKGNKVRIVGISDDLNELLGKFPKYTDSNLLLPGLRNAPGQTMIPYGKRSYSRIRKRFTDYFAEANVQGTLHKFRHTFASQMLMKGVGERTVQMLLGHESITTTEVYSHLTTDFLIQSMNHLRVSELRGD